MSGRGSVDSETGEIVRDDDGNPRMEPAETTKYSDAILLKLAAAHMPEQFGDHKTVDVRHQAIARPGHWTITSNDLEALSDDDKGQLMRILSHVRAARDGKVIDAKAEPAKAIEYAPA